MTQQILKVKPIQIVTNDRGQLYYQFEDNGLLGSALMAPFQIGKPLPDSISVVKRVNEEGKCSYHQCKYELLRQLYKIKGTVTLTVQSIGKEQGMNMYKLYLKDSFGFVHIYLCREGSSQFRKGCKLNFEYKLMRLGETDGYLSLTSLDQLEDKGFLHPNRFMASCRHSQAVEACYEQFRKHPDSHYHRMESQIMQQSNLWIMTFMNHLRQRIDHFAKTKRYNKLKQYATAYETIERRIVADDSYIGAFKSEKQDEMRSRIESEIIHAWTIRVAVQLRQKQCLDRFMAHVETQLKKAQALSNKQIRLLVELLNMDTTLIGQYVHTIAHLLLSSQSQLDQTTGPMLCLHSIMDNYINHKITEINKEIHIKDNPAEESMFVHVIQLVGIQIMLLDPVESRAVVRLKTAQLCRLISYLLDDLKATLMVKKAIALLSANIQPQLSLSDFEELGIPELADKLLAIHTTPVGEPLQFLGAGSVVFYQGRISICSLQQYQPHANPTEGTTLHQLMDGLINLRTQNNPETLLGTFGLMEEGWQKIYETIQTPNTERSCPLTPGVYPLSFYHINREKPNRVFFYVKDKEGNAYKAIMYPNGLFSIPCEDMSNIFEFGDKFYGNVIKVAQNVAIVSIAQSIYNYCNQKVSTGDSFVASCIELHDNEAIFFGENGALCKALVHSAIEIGGFYQVTVKEMPPKQAKYVFVTNVKPSVSTFDPRAVSKENIRNYINAHSADTGERVARIYATELLYLLDRMVLLTKDLHTKYFYYQYLKLTSCIVRTKMSYIYEALSRLIKDRIEHPTSHTRPVTAEDLRNYPRLAGELT